MRMLCPACSKKEVWTKSQKTPEDQVSKALTEVGSVLLSQYVNARSNIQVACTVCGAPITTTWDRLRSKGELNPPVCKACRGLVDVDWEKEAASAGIELLSLPKKQKDKIHFTCLLCGEEFSSTGELLKNRKSKLFCPVCSGRRYSAQQLERKAASLSTKLISWGDGQVEFICVSCGEVGKTSQAAFMSWTTALCSNCRPNARKTILEVREWFESRGAVLLSESYKNNKTPLRFLCKFCGKETQDTWDTLKSGGNPNLLCRECRGVARTSPQEGVRRRRSADVLWYTLVREFFGVGQNFAAHHIKPYSKYPELRTSVLNGYPLSKDVHSNTFVYDGQKNPFHTNPSWEDPVNWPKELVLPAHTITSPRRFDNLVTEIVFSPMDLLEKKRDFGGKGVEYIPILYEEVSIPTKRNILYSMLRAKLWSTHKDIYDYTNSRLQRVFARNTIVKQLSGSEAKQFLEISHIQGFLPSEYYFGLLHKDIIQAVMSFSRPRFSMEAQFELTRYAVAQNTQIIGGAQKLFKFSVSSLKATSVISYADIRFASLDPARTLYPRLNFEFVGDTQPSYFWVDPATNRRLTRFATQKHRLAKLLPNFDPSKSESENMEAAGWIKIKDCGNHKFIWRK